MDSPTATLIQILRDRVNKLVSEGNYDEAVHAASAAVEKAQQALSSDLESIDEFANTLELRGELYRSIGRPEDAREDFKGAIDQLDNRPDRQLQIARLHATLGAVYDDLGQTDRAGSFWEKALELFEKQEPPSPLDVALMANNLAYLRKTSGDIDGAETYFLKALQIYHELLGPDHEETATVSNNLGALYHASGYFEQAREMHMMALEARRQKLGDEHPDTAQSHNNLALALLETGDRSWARRHFEKSLAAFEQLGAPYRQDLEAVADNFCSFLRAEGETTTAERIEGKLRELVGA
ncbi:MAG: tetratricopeptide repeat protein [Akkermansiaceae bacterium]|jgi:tetratricopeptide (TPR) repeat protein|nr:tetratricopeptide repeat protein [Akkermansiaceae bacterium]